MFVVCTYNKNDKCVEETGFQCVLGMYSLNKFDLRFANWFRSSPFSKFHIFPFPHAPLVNRPFKLKVSKLGR